MIDRKRILDAAIETMDKAEWPQNPTIGSVVRFVSIAETLEFLRSECK